MESEDICPCGWCVAARAMRAPHPLGALQANGDEPLLPPLEVRLYTVELSDIIMKDDEAPTARALPIAALRADRQRIGLFVP